MNLFMKALLEAYKQYGNCRVGMQIRDVHLYRWKCEVGGEVIDDTVYANWEYLADVPDPGWAIHDLTVANAIKESNRDALYIGGGGGRFSKAIHSWGLDCHTIDLDPVAIELMTLRGVACEIMDGSAMSFADDSYPLVVVAPAVLDSSPDPQALFLEAARVASERVVVSGWAAGAVWGEVSQDTTPVAIHETMTWQYTGETDESDGWSYHWDHVLEMLAVAGMVPDKVVTFLPDAARLEVSWVIEARF